MTAQKQAAQDGDKDLITIDEALAMIMQHRTFGTPCRVPLREGLGMVLAEDCHAPFDLPPHDHAAMDGYAFCCADAAQGELRACGFLPAGCKQRDEVPQGEAVRIMTGAPVPPSCDTVVPFENLIVEQNCIRFTKPFQAGDNIRRQGEDIRQGELLLAAGTVLRPQEIALLSAISLTDLPVYRRLKVAVLATGDELLEPGSALQPGKIINSNSNGLAAMLLDTGAEPVLMGIAQDTLEATTAKIEVSCAADIILVTGGASAGDHDFVRAAIEDLGGTILFSGVQIKPGKPFGFARLQHKPVFIMPGNPVAAMIIFELFVRPFLLRGMGRQKIFRPSVQALLTEKTKNKGARPHFVGGLLTSGSNGYQISVTGSQSSGRIASLTQANCLVYLAPETSWQPGDQVTALLIDPEAGMKTDTPWD